MNLFFFLEARYTKDKNGQIFNSEGVLRHPLWERYLPFFDKVFIIARVKYVPDYIGKTEHLANGKGVEFIELPYYHGPKEFVKIRRKLINIIKLAVKHNAAFLLRVPGQIGTIASRIISRQNKEYGVEVVGDPYDVFSKGSVIHPLRFFFKYKYYYDLKRIVSEASSVLYVTEQVLQSRYKANINAFTTSASNVILNNCDIKDVPRNYDTRKKSYSLISIGSLEQMYKAPDVVLNSIKLVNSSQHNFEIRLTWIGAGRYLKEMKLLAIHLGIEDKVDFVGYVSDKSTIINHLDKSDFFVLASRTEGLPRVIIEAMARGLPVIGTKVGGIPELVSDNLLISKSSPSDLADKIIFLVNNQDYANMESLRNLNLSRNYLEEKLTIKRNKFYQSLQKLPKHL